MRNADSATKSKYNFKTINSFTLQEYSYYAPISKGGSADHFDVFKEINPTSCPVGSIIYISNNISTSNSDKYTLNKNNTISAGYYKIKAICNRSSSMYGATYTNYAIDSVSQSSLVCNLIPFSMQSGYGYGDQYGSASHNYTADEILPVLQKYIEYLGTSYKVPQV